MQMVKVVLSGTISGTQTWSTGFWLNTAGATWTQDDLNDANDDWAGLIFTASGSWATLLFGENTTATRVTSYLYAPGAIVSSLISTDFVSSADGSGDSLPSLLAIVASTRSPIPGRSGRGRNYFPLTKASALDADGQLNATSTAALAEGIATMFTNINAHTVNGIQPIVSVRSVFKGTSYAVTRVVVNSLVDVQHRREDTIAITTDVSEAVA
jgi:hypothetical protein